MYNPKRNSSGFTLVELLVVMAIVGILAVGLVVAINPLEMMAKSRDTVRKNTLGQIQRALENYRIANGTYPNNGTYCGESGSPWSTCGSDWIPGLVSAKEIKVLPTDPRRGQNAAPACTGQPTWTSYLYISNGTSYKLMAHCGMEAQASRDACSAAKFSAGTQDPMCDPLRPTYTWAVWSDATGRDSW